MPGGTTLAQAYVQVLPTTKGMKSNLENGMGEAGDSAGEKAGSRFSGAFKKFVLAGAAVAGAGLTKSLLEGAALEQNLGGTEAVFGDYYTEIQNKANEAYKKMGLSASDYMATANKMGSLFQGSGLSQKKSLNMTADAMQRAADVASVMGVDMDMAMESIAGAAKGNFTMMDNLGVKMDAAAISAYALEKGVNFDWNTASNAEKTEMAIKMFMDRTKQYEGNFANETEKTLSGSFDAMRAAADNFLGNLSMRPELISESMQSLVSTANIFLFKNLIPAIGNVIKALPVAVKTFMSQGIPQLMESGKALLDGILKGMSGNMDFMSKLMPMLAGLSKQILNASGSMVDAGMKILQKLAEGIAKGLPAVIKYAPKIIGNLADVINKNAPKIIKGAFKIMLILGKGLIKAIPILIQNIPQIFKAFLKVWEAVNWLNLGKIAITGIKKGITALTKNLSEPVKQAFTKVKNAILAPSNAAKNALSKIITSIKQKINFAGIKEKVSASFRGIKDKITKPFTDARDALKKVKDKIKGLFPLKIGKIMSNLKIPKLKLNGGKAPYGFGGKGKMPSISINWHAKAMDNPYMFDGATLFGAGEAGDEVLYGRKSLMRDISEAVGSMQSSGSGNVIGGTVQLVINLDGKTIGQSTIDYINGQTLMFGTSPVMV